MSRGEQAVTKEPVATSFSFSESTAASSRSQWYVTDIRTGEDTPPKALTRDKLGGSRLSKGESGASAIARAGSFNSPVGTTSDRTAVAEVADAPHDGPRRSPSGPAEGPLQAPPGFLRGASGALVWRALPSEPTSVAATDDGDASASATAERPVGARPPGIGKGTLGPAPPAPPGRSPRKRDVAVRLPTLPLGKLSAMTERSGQFKLELDYQCDSRATSFSEEAAAIPEVNLREDALDQAVDLLLESGGSPSGWVALQSWWRRTCKTYSCMSSFAVPSSVQMPVCEAL